LADLANVDATTDKPIDGRSLRQLLFEEERLWQPRQLFSIRKDQVSVRTQQYRLDAVGKLYDIAADPGQRADISREHPDLTRRLVELTRRHGAEMQRDFQKHADRPFLVGYAESTTLPARDGIEHGTIQRSSKAPNNSFFTHWTNPDDSITWDVEVAVGGQYEAIVYYTCAEGDQGASITLSMESGESSSKTAGAKVTEVFDPPLYDKSKERVEKSHYFVKDFRPLSLGKLELAKGRSVLRLSADAIQGKRAIDVHSIELLRQ
jgi:hypothetical protein